MGRVPDAEALQLIAATADIVGRTGASDFNVEYHELENGERVVWFAYAGYPDGRWEVGSGVNPTAAALRLAEALIDGGTCAHCSRPTAIDHNWRQPIPSDATAPWCAYIYDPSTHRFVRGCAGSNR